MVLPNRSGSWFFGDKVIPYVVVCLALAGTSLAATLALLLISPLRINHDAAVYLIIGQLLLGGKVPYVDYFEVNLPLMHYIGGLTVWVAHLLKSNPISVFQVGVLILTVGSEGTIGYLGLKYLDRSKREIVAPIILAISFLTLTFMLNNDYGQREHLFILMMLPYVFGRWLRWQGTKFRGWEAVSVGLLAGFGTCIKPHFVIIVAALELYGLIEFKRLRLVFRLETVALFSVGIIYGAHFLLVPADMLRNMIRALNFAVEGYSAFGNHPVDRLILRNYALLIIGLSPFVAYPLGHKESPGVLLRALGACVLAGLVVFAIQGKNWSYQLMPAVMSAAIMVAIWLSLPSSFATLEADNNLRRTDGGSQVVRVLFLIVVVAGISIFWLDLPRSLHEWSEPIPSNDGLTETILVHTEPGSTVFLQSVWVHPFRRMLQLDRRLAPTYIPANPPAFAYGGLADSSSAYDPTTPLHPMVAKYLSDLSDEIDKYQPELVLIDQWEGDFQGCRGCPPNFSLARFLFNRGFIEGSITPTYQRTDEVKDWDTYYWVGPPTSTMSSPIVFDEALKLYAWELPGGQTAEACQQILFRSWWRAAAPTEKYLSMTLVLEAEGQGIANIDGAIGGVETAQWHVDTRHADERSLDIPCDARSGEYSLLVALYDTLGSNQLVPVAYPDGTPIGEYFYLTTISIR